MKLTPVEKLPDGRSMSPYKSLDRIFDEFGNSSATIVLVTFGKDEYKNPTSCSSALNAGIAYRNLPYRAVIRNGDVYLTKPVIFRMPKEVDA